MLTFAQLKTRVATTLQDTTSPYFWSRDTSTSELDTYLNDGVREWAIATQGLRQAITLTPSLTADASRPLAFWVPPGGQAIVGWFDLWNAGRRLVRTTLAAELDRLSTWEDEQGTPDRYILGDFGQDTVRLVPSPPTTLTSLRALVSLIPDDMVAAADYPAIPAMYHHLLHDYAVARAFMRDGEKQDLNVTDRWMSRWQQAIADATKKQNQGYDRSTRSIQWEAF